MAPLARCWRFISGVSIPVSTFVSFTCMLIFIFILYQPTPGPGILQRLGWQSWESVSTAPRPNIGTDSTSNQPKPAESASSGGVEWWNVTQTEETVDGASLPLDGWAPLLPHDTGFSEIAVTHCFVNPRLASVCDPASTPEKDAMMGKFVRVDRNLNFDAGYFSGYLNIYYRRTRRQDVKLITDIKLLSNSQSPPSKDWVKAPTSLRSGVLAAPALHLWYKLGKTASEMSKAERSNLITELDVLYGDDIPWTHAERLVDNEARGKTYGSLYPPFFMLNADLAVPPRAPPLHFSHNGQFKVVQVADLHFSVAETPCRDTATSFSCPGGSDSTTSKTLISVMLDIEKPDLVVFSGDQLNGQGTSWDSKSVLAKFSREVASRGIPWAVVFGNHDEDSGAIAKEEQVKLMKALPYSLVEAGPKDIHGVGNYVLKVLSADPSKMHLLTLYFLDSGSYSRGFYNLWGWFTPTAYDWIRQSQIDWFMQESASIKPIERPFNPDRTKDLGHVWRRQRADQLVPQIGKLAKPNALMFFHMPLPETYNKADTGSNGRPLDVGISGQEDKGSATDSDGFFTKGILKALETDNSRDPTPEVKVIGNGHSHLTENCRRVNGVWFCFGGGGSYSGYGKLGFDRRFRVYDISDFGETIRTYKRTEHDGFKEILDDLVLVGKGART
ncbi:AIP3 domain-containing protein [Mycena indigotica]|uniref:AIP3 domain-containing protein n=1 Tax=Mycena indigotica TaxID=2126181 RepID=A0A8H6T1A0_9AGAR|nr:AIP3 domain-containing protein [Mycena indigotica]KAF7309823.1 AIP3 domain-containing protein [Mycena indigotica]